MDMKVMYQLTYGLYVLTAREGDKDNGCIINTAAQITTTPNRISIAVNKQNYTHGMIMNTKEFNVSVLITQTPFDTFKNFGYQSGKVTDKMASISYLRASNGIAYLTEQSSGYISGKVAEIVDLGTHTLFIADVADAQVLSEQEPVTYAYYQNNIKPAPEKPVNNKKGYICTICGYIYEGEELPEDYICPICKHGAVDFEKL